MTKPNDEQRNRLIDTLKDRHGSRFEDLQIKGGEFAHCLGSLPGFKLIEARPPRRHVGGVIVGGVLQVGHSYERQVRRAVDRIKLHDQAAAISGFMKLIESKPLNAIIGWNENTKIDLLNVAKFFQVRSVDTFDQLYAWLELEQNRDRLITDIPRRQGSVFRVSDKTADYFRKLVGHWDAVAVDRGIRGLLANTNVFPPNGAKKWYYERRAIVQLAALELGCTPRDLDSSIYSHYVGAKSG